MISAELDAPREIKTTFPIQEENGKNAFVVGGSPLEQQALRTIFFDMGYAAHSLTHIELLPTAPIEPGTLVLARLERSEKWDDVLGNILQACSESPVVLMVPKSTAIQKLQGLPTNVRAVVYTGLPTKSLVSIIGLVADGMSVLPHMALETITAPSIDIASETGEIDRLTIREQDIAAKVAEGLSSKEIGRALNISVNTVNAHLNAVMRKLDLTKRTQVAIWWMRESAKSSGSRKAYKCARAKNDQAVLGRTVN